MRISPRLQPSTVLTTLLVILLSCVHAPAPAPVTAADAGRCRGVDPPPGGGPVNHRSLLELDPTGPSPALVGWFVCAFSTAVAEAWWHGETLTISWYQPPGERFVDHLMSQVRALPREIWETTELGGCSAAAARGIDLRQRQAEFVAFLESRGPDAPPFCPKPRQILFLPVDSPQDAARAVSHLCERSGTDSARALAGESFVIINDLHDGLARWRSWVKTGL